MKLTKMEKQILEDFREGKFKEDKLSRKEKQEYADAAKATKVFMKDKRITIRINSVDLEKLKEQAYQAGKKYQTYLGDILHRQACKVKTKTA